MDLQKAPFGTKFLMGLLMGGIDDAFYIPELKKNLKYLENIIHKQHEKVVTTLLAINSQVLILFWNSCDYQHFPKQTWG